jgi:1-acyl-sn-glycerol-3-phosphate acyltransferase
MSEQTVFVPGRLPPWGGEALRRIVVALFWIAARVRVCGSENMPPAGGFIFASNHLSVLDVALGFTVSRGYRIAIFAGDTWRKDPIVGKILRLVNVIWVHRGETSPSTIKTAIRVLREGFVLGVAPEGARNKKSHALLKGKPGAAYLARMAGVPIVPVGIANTQNLWRSMKRFHRIEVSIIIGKPFTLEAPSHGTRVDRGQLEKYTDEIMCRIAMLLPPEYRGAYADHPRLIELLRSE